MSFLPKKSKPEPAHITFSQPCDDASTCAAPAVLANHASWTVPNIGRVHQYFCAVHWEARQERLARKLKKASKP